ncbi:hypothetical protein ElyMa_003835300 [Elysia marginata]|uniref:Cubilin n=1 Tax=Elysia marginata TaxID=1093978 RepID=A0AAV4FIN9_9GAST|nr:hypothetical protein ElyMa_003835300 [Elysia marginata]
MGLCYFNNGGCNSLATCSESAGNVQCACPKGYSGDAIGEMGCISNSKIGGCYYNPCLNGGTCEPSGTHKFRCTCAAGFHGFTCAQPRNPCEDVQCQNDGVCKASKDMKYALCSCKPGFTGFSCELQEQVPELTSTYNEIHLWFRSDHSGGSQGFSFEWTSRTPECGGDFRLVDRGEIKSPGYPQQYSPHRDCVWTVFVNPGSRVSFTLPNLDLGKDSTCNGNFLEILDGQTERHPVLRKWCTSISAHTIHTSGPFAFVRFHSSKTRSGRRFKITFKADSGRPRAIFEVETLTLSVDITGTQRESAMPKQKRIIGPETDGPETSLGYEICIRDGGDQTADTIEDRFCKIPGTLKSTNHEMLIEMHTDSAMKGQGFQASYKTGCGGHYNSGRYFEHFRSPDYPYPYNHNQVCIYTFTTSKDRSVYLIPFIRFYTASTTSCKYDYLEFFDGKDIHSPHIPPKVCHYHRPLVVYSTSPSLTVKFQSDASNNSMTFFMLHRSERSMYKNCLFMDEFCF